MIAPTAPVSLAFPNPSELIQCSAGVVPATQQSLVYFFLDFSNLAVNASYLASRFGDGLLRGQDVRLSSTNLRLFVQRNRQWGNGYAAAALSDQQSRIKHHFELQGIRFDIFERGEITGTEQNVDERIQLEMYRLNDSGCQKGTVVLATGDGAGFRRGEGFLRILTTLHQSGFAVEVMSWRHSFNKVLKTWATAHGRAIELNDYYYDLTFVQGGRQATHPIELGKKIARKGLISV